MSVYPVARTVELRKSINPIIPKELRLPFAFIQDQFGYTISSIVRHIHCEPILRLDPYPNTFPNNIQEYYWIYTLPGAGMWTALGRMTNGIYFLYAAQCNKTFMNKNGNMVLWISTRYASLIHFAMNETLYQQYINGTIEAVPQETIEASRPQGTTESK